MTEDQIPEHHFRCTHCGRLVDMRSLPQVFSHADPFTGLTVCLTDEEIAAAERQAAPITSRKVGDPTEWRDGKPTHLN